MGIKKKKLRSVMEGGGGGLKELFRNTKVYVLQRDTQLGSQVFDYWDYY